MVGGKMRPILLLVLLSVLPSLASAQLSAYSDRAVSTISVLSPPGAVVLGPISYGQVRVCTGNALFTSPCTPLASIFDQNGTPLIVAGGGFGQVTTDVTGHFSFQCNPGVMTIQVAPSSSNNPQLNYLTACPTTLPINLTNGGVLGGIFTGAATINLINPGVFTNTQANLYVTSSLGGMNIATFFSSAFGGQHQTDAISGGLIVPVGATAVNNDGVAGYCQTLADSAGRTKANCTPLFGLGIASANNSAVWGLNTVTADATGLTGHNMTGYEADMNLLGSPAFFKGILLTGLNQGGTLPASATGFEIATPYQLPYGFVTDRHSANVGLQLNDTLSTNPSPSQSFQAISHDSGGTAHISQINEDSNGNWVIIDLHGGGTSNFIAQIIASGTATMTTAAITAGNCGTTVTVSATSVATTDTITWAFNSAPSGTNAGVVAWPTSGNVNFAYCPGVAETPAAATINWRVVR